MSEHKVGCDFHGTGIKATCCGASPGPTGTAGEPDDEALYAIFAQAADAAVQPGKAISTEDWEKAGLRAVWRAAAAGAAPADVIDWGEVTRRAYSIASEQARNEDERNGVRLLIAAIDAAAYGGAAPASPADISLRAALIKAVGLMDEIYRAHRDRKDAGYNECESAPCQWCTEVDEVRAALAAEGEPADG